MNKMGETWLENTEILNGKGILSDMSYRDHMI